MGVAQYVASHRPWRVELSVASTSTRSIEQVNADGLILPVITEPQRDAVLKLGIPTVSIAGNLRDTGFPAGWRPSSSSSAGSSIWPTAASGTGTTHPAEAEAFIAPWRKRASGAMCMKNLLRQHNQTEPVITKNNCAAG